MSKLSFKGKVLMALSLAVALFGSEIFTKLIVDKKYLLGVLACLIAGYIYGTLIEEFIREVRGE